MATIDVLMSLLTVMMVALKLDVPSRLMVSMLATLVRMAGIRVDYSPISLGLPLMVSMLRFTELNAAVIESLNCFSLMIRTSSPPCVTLLLPLLLRVVTCWRCCYGCC